MSKLYFEYLLNISTLGKFYRKYLVYPLIRNFSRGRTLDVGCGIGLFLEFDKKTVGVDINKYCVEYCQERFPGRVFLMEKDLLPFNESSFETLILDNVIEHISDVKPLMAEIKRVLTLGGRAVIIVPGVKGYRNDTDHKKFYDFDALKILAENNGFDVVAFRSIPAPFLSKILSPFCYFAVLTNNK